MGLLALILLISSAFILARVRLFECTVAVLLLTPIVAFIPSGSIPIDSIGYFIIATVLTTGLAFFAHVRRSEVTTWDLKEELIPIGILAIGFLFFYNLCQSWPDFMQMGERFRDYALLSSVINFPHEAREPWMSGSVLNYYLYWYRFGHMLSAWLNLEVWQVYNQLQSFTFALYLACAYRFFRRHLTFSISSSLFSALVIAIGSNISGILFFLKQDDNWWGPSRVILGAINEFPAWSFLLGDVHPHYLNLALVPFLMLCFLSVMQSGARQVEKIAFAVAFIVVTPFWIFNSNAWEIPIWLGLLTLSFGLGILSFCLNQKVRTYLKEVLVWPKEPWGLLTIIGFAALMVCSLYLSSRNISPGDTPLRWIPSHEPSVAMTFIGEFFKHWGFPISLVTIALIVLIPGLPWKLLCVVLIVSTALTNLAIYPLIMLSAVNFARVILNLSKFKNENGYNFPLIAIEAIGIGALGLLIVPELIFFDDGYGGDNERMNTIFKIYSADWLLLHTFAFYLCSRACATLNSYNLYRQLVGPLQLAALILICGFFFRTAKVRTIKDAHIKPREQGLSEVDSRFHGSGVAIQKLRLMPQGVVLEAQGNAYDYTSFVSTLSEKEAFLGWANHINLLTRNYAEVTRREQVTKDFYSASSCEARKEIMSKEKITYAVYGVLEKQRFPGIPNEGFGCLSKIIDEVDYQIYKL